MKMSSKFVFVVREVWQSVVWLTHRRCAHLPQCRYCVFLDIGGNDATTRAALGIAQDLVHGLGVVNVVIGQLLRRDPRKSPAGYNDEVLKINTHLQQLTLGLHHIHFWRHRGFWADLSHLGRDGVHLRVESYANSPAPMVKYIRSIKYAVHNRMQKIKASSHCILYKFHVKWSQTK